MDARNTKRRKCPSGLGEMSKLEEKLVREMIWAELNYSPAGQPAADYLVMTNYLPADNCFLVEA
jgi:hypothetical protein